jgi:hypothetical protein
MIEYIHNQEKHHELSLYLVPCSTEETYFFCIYRNYASPGSSFSSTISVSSLSRRADLLWVGSSLSTSFFLGD